MMEILQYLQLTLLPIFPLRPPQPVADKKLTAGQIVAVEALVALSYAYFLIVWIQQRGKSFSVDIHSTT